MNYIGIVGHEAAKFTNLTERKAKRIIAKLLAHPNICLVSGGCHLGGIDIWAEDVARVLAIPIIIYKPKNQSWHNGYRERNIKIAEKSNEVHVIVVSKYPPTYTGMKFKLCYHCNVTTHIKSGGCWTGKVAQKLGKKVIWHEL